MKQKVTTYLQPNLFFYFSDKKPKNTEKYLKTVLNLVFTIKRF